MHRPTINASASGTISGMIFSVITFTDDEWSSLSPICICILYFIIRFNENYWILILNNSLELKTIWIIPTYFLFSHEKYTWENIIQIYWPNPLQSFFFTKEKLISSSIVCKILNTTNFPIDNYIIIYKETDY